jgi:hypothetical protein
VGGGKVGGVIAGDSVSVGKMGVASKETPDLKQAVNRMDSEKKIAEDSKFLYFISD